MSLIRRLALCLTVLALGCTSTALGMSLTDPTLFALTVRIGYVSGLLMSTALAVTLFVILTVQKRQRPRR
jgi:hypothetical protein